MPWQQKIFLIGNEIVHINSKWLLDVVTEIASKNLTQTIAFPQEIFLKP